MLTNDEKSGKTGFWGKRSKNGIEEWHLGSVILVKSESKPKAYDNAIEIATGVWLILS